MTPNPAYLRALQDSVRTASYPQLIGMKLAAIDLDSCRIDLQLNATCSRSASSTAAYWRR